MALIAAVEIDLQPPVLRTRHAFLPIPLPPPHRIWRRGRSHGRPAAILSRLMTLELPLGASLDWTPVQRPTRAPLAGAHVVLRPVVAATDAESLYAASHPPGGDSAIWTYLPDGPYASPPQLRRMLEWAEPSADRIFFPVAPLPDGRPRGICSYLRIEPDPGAIEIAPIWSGAPLQPTPAATEAIYLLASHAFDDLHYRRLE